MSADNWAVCPKCKEGQSFREDYELGVLETGEFYIIYDGYCRLCELSHKFKHSEFIYKAKP